MTAKEKEQVKLLASALGISDDVVAALVSGKTTTPTATRKSKAKRVEAAYYSLKAKTPKHERPAMRKALGFIVKGRGTNARMETCREWVARVGVNEAAKALHVR